MSRCLPKARASVDQAAGELEQYGNIVGIDVLSPETSAHGRWTLEMTIVGVAGLPAEVAVVLGRHALTTPICQRQGDNWRVVAHA